MASLNIALKGKLNYPEAEGWFDSVVKALEEGSYSALCIDCRELEYLSSIWLRQMLKVKKKGYEIRCVNVSRDVYEIFEMTGFTNVLQVKKALREIAIDEDKLLARGSVGTVYKLREDMIIKVFHSGVSFDMVRREREYAKSVFLAGIPTVISYDIVKVNDRYGIVYEMADADTFSAYLSAHMDRFDDLAGKYAGLLKQINRTSFAPGRFPAAKELYRQYVEQSGFLSAEEKETLYRLIDAVPERTTLLHGDFHANNIMLHENELTLIDLGDATLGHPVFDLASMVVSHILVGGYQPEFIKRGMGLDVGVCRRLMESTLRSYFAGDSEDEIGRKEKIIRSFAHLKLACMYTIVPGIENVVTYRPLEDARKVLFTDPDALIADLKETESW